MGKKIIVLCGSPRKKGNTNTVVKWFAEGARKAGAKVKIVDVANLKYKSNGCIACMGCKKWDKYQCVIKDEATPILASLPRYDVIVFATPVFFFGPTAQLKLFLDRTYSLFKFDKKTGEFVHQLGGKTFALIATSGGPRESCLKPLEDTFSQIAQLTGLKLECLVEPFSSFDTKEFLRDKKDLKKKAAAFGKKLAR